MSEDKRTNAASFKLSLFETAAADPLLKPIDSNLLVAYAKFMKWPRRTAYLSNIKARVLTGASEPTISKSRARLVKYEYLKPVMTKTNRSVIYEVNNPRADLVADHIEAATEKLKEDDAYRKEVERQRKRETLTQEAKETLAPECELPKENLVTERPVPKETLAPKEREDQRNLGDMTQEIYDNSLDIILGRRAPKESNNINAYAIASQGL